MAEYVLGILHWLGNRTIDINLEILVCLNCLLSEPGFSGFQDFQDWELVIIYSVVKDERLPFAKEHWNIYLLSC